MNIQIFGHKKSFDTKKAERFFKERKIKYQFIDILDKGISPKEYQSVKSAIKDIDALIDEKNPLYKSLFIENQQSLQAKEQKLLDNPGLFKLPIVRNGKQATVGEASKIWKNWQ